MWSRCVPYRPQASVRWQIAATVTLLRPDGCLSTTSPRLRVATRDATRICCRRVPLRAWTVHCQRSRMDAGTRKRTYRCSPRVILGPIATVRHVANIPGPKLVRQRGLHQLRRAADWLPVVVVAWGVAAVATVRQPERACRAANIASFREPQALTPRTRSARPRRARVSRCWGAVWSRVVAWIRVPEIVAWWWKSQPAVRSGGTNEQEPGGDGAQHLSPIRVPSVPEV